MMLKMGRTGRMGNRGILLISSYFVLSLFLIYSSALVLRMGTQGMVADRLRDRFQTMNLAEGAMEQLRDDLYEFFRVKVYHDRYAGDALSSMAWLDTLGPNATQASDPPLALSATAAGTSMNGATGMGTSAAPRLVTLPSMTGKNWTAKAWVVQVTNTGGILSPRDVTIEAQVTRPNPPGPDLILKRTRATYRFELAMSDIFRYGYFVNNYGWFDLGDNGFVQIDGDIRSNGDFTFSGNASRLWLDGDVFASQNAELVNPNDPFGQPAQGLISGDTNQDGILGNGWYFSGKRDRTRPERRKTFPGQPTIGGGPTEHLPYGQGWDTQDADPYNDSLDEQRFERQSVQDIPYLGDLNLYKTLAQERGSTLIFATPGPDGIYGSWDDGQTTVNAVHAGAQPLVIVGTQDHPIQISGPIVVEGDVIIKGMVRGQGAIYAGRNVHIVGDLWYDDPPQWPSVWRNQYTGQVDSETYPDLGAVCNDGTYVPANGSPPESRCP